jgi:signal transduction histidine kinase
MQLGVAVDAVPEESPMKPRLDRVLQVMSRGIEEGRSAIQGLRSSDSATRDLVIAFSGIEQELSCRPDIDFRVNVVGRQQPLNAPIQEEIYRIGREALLNAFCHSRAKRIEFELEYADRELQMRVRDDGIGINPQVLHDGRKGHWGLVGMQERAGRIGGLLKISSSPSNGTEVRLSIPSGIAFRLSTIESRT